MYVVKAAETTFVQKICLFDIDEIDSSCNCQAWAFVLKWSCTASLGLEPTLLDSSEGIELYLSKCLKYNLWLKFI